MHTGVLAHMRIALYPALDADLGKKPDVTEFSVEKVV